MPDTYREEGIFLAQLDEGPNLTIRLMIDYETEEKRSVDACNPLGVFHCRHFE